MLTYAALRKIKPEEKSKKYSDAHGLYLEVSPNGKKYWRMKYRFDSKENRYSIGNYPLMSLAAELGAMRLGAC